MQTEFKAKYKRSKISWHLQKWLSEIWNSERLLTKWPTREEDSKSYKQKLWLLTQTKLCKFHFKVKLGQTLWLFSQPPSPSFPISTIKFLLKCCHKVRKDSRITTILSTKVRIQLIKWHRVTLNSQKSCSINTKTRIMDRFRSEETRRKGSLDLDSTPKVNLKKLYQQTDLMI